MIDDSNPYQSPAAEISAAIAHPRPFPKMWSFFVGAVLGCLSFIAAIALVPGDVPNPSVHDLLLANHLGFIFPPLVGLWCGWIRRSWPWAVGDAAIGFAIGGCYYLLCGYNFFVVMVAFPCLLGGVASVAFGRGAGSWFDGFFARLGKGLVAGFVLGFVYMVVLNVLGIAWFPMESTQEYHRMMWHTGPVAMSVASGLYLVVFVWASNLGTHDAQTEERTGDE